MAKIRSKGDQPSLFPDPPEPEISQHRPNHKKTRQRPASSNAPLNPNVSSRVSSRSKPDAGAKKIASAKRAGRPGKRHPAKAVPIAKPPAVPIAKPPTANTGPTKDRSPAEAAALPIAWYTVAEAATHYRVSEKTIRRHMKDGSLRFKKFGRLIRISPEALAAAARD